MKIKPNTKRGIAQIWFVIVGGVVVLHVIMVPIFLGIAWAHRITVRPGQAATLPAALTSPPMTGAWAMPVHVAAAPVAATPAASTLSIEHESGLVRITVPAWSSLWTSDTGLPDSWTWVQDCYDVTVHIREAGGQCGFFSVRPIARP